MAFDMISTGLMALSTFIVFNSYCDQLKVPIGNYVSYKQVTDKFDKTFKNIFDMLDDEELINLKKD